MLGATNIEKAAVLELLLQNRIATEKCLTIDYNFNGMIVSTGMIELSVADSDFFMVFSIPQKCSKNIFFAISENSYKIASLCVAYCEYCTYGHQADFGENISFDTVEIDELKHIKNILLLSIHDSLVLESYDDDFMISDKIYQAHLCLPCFEDDMPILANFNIHDVLLEFEKKGKDFMIFE